jgi:hypothetical protein
MDEMFDEGIFGGVVLGHKFRKSGRGLCLVVS